MQHKVRELKFIKLYEKENLKNCTCRRHKVVNWTSRNFNIGPVNYSSAARSDYSFQYIYLFGTSTSSCNLKTTGGPFDGFAVRERRCLEPRIAPSGTFASKGLEVTFLFWILCQTFWYKGGWVLEVYLDANSESGGHVGAEQDRTRSLLAYLYGNLDQQKLCQGAWQALHAMLW